MKKIGIGILIIVSIIVIGVISFEQFVTKKSDVVLKSKDEKIEFTLEKVTVEKTWAFDEFSIAFTIAEGIDFYQDYVKDNTY